MARRTADTVARGRISMRPLLPAGAALWIAASFFCTQPYAAEAASPEFKPGLWVRLFDGKTLDGWIPKFAGYKLGVNYRNTFVAHDGVLGIYYDAYKNRFEDEYGHLAYKTPFSNYRLRMEYRFVGTQLDNASEHAIRNSGVMVHGEAPETMTVEQDFPVSIEAQLLSGNGHEVRPTANACMPGTRIVVDGELVTTHCRKSTSETFPKNQWIQLEIEAHGSKSVEHKVNGKTVLRYTDPHLDVTHPHARELIEKNGGKMRIDGGYIYLQAESHPIEFRNIELMVLPD
jgi:hypothetical protein